MKIFFALLFLFAGVTTAWSQNTYHEITLPELMKKYRQNASNMVIVDVRTKGEYHDSSTNFRAGNIGRIKGVTNIELQELESNPASLKALEQYKDKEVYLLCSHSYRSRNASNILTRNGFKNVNNVQGGMTEWYRRYDDLLPYRSMLETSVKYKNISSAQLYDLLAGNRDILLIGINAKPRTFFDSTTATFLKYLPTFKKAIYFDVSDSAKVLELAKQSPRKPIVFFNYTGQGADMASFLANKGVPDVQYVIGGLTYFFEYVANKNLLAKAAPLQTASNTIRFVTPVHYSEQLAGKANTVVVDLRQDSLFHKVSRGIKSDFNYVKSSQNFPFSKTAYDFEKAYPDKKGQYVLISRNGFEGIELADELSRRGYTVYWILGGIGRFDWYTINTDAKACQANLVRP